MREVFNPACAIDVESLSTHLAVDSRTLIICYVADNQGVGNCLIVRELASARVRKDYGQWGVREGLSC